MWHEKETPWSTPCGHYFMPHGVLHVVTISCHMEYSIWSFLGAIWSTLGINTEVNFHCHMEYSMWLLFDAIWSSPYGHCGVDILTWCKHGLEHGINISSKMVLSWSTQCQLVKDTN